MPKKPKNPKSKFINVELDEEGKRSLLVVKLDLGVGRDVEVMRYLLRQAYNNIPQERRSALEKKIDEELANQKPSSSD